MDCGLDRQVGGAKSSLSLVPVLLEYWAIIVFPQKIDRINGSNKLKEQDYGPVLEVLICQVLKFSTHYILFPIKYFTLILNLAKL